MDEIYSGYAAVSVSLNVLNVKHKLDFSSRFASCHVYDHVCSLLPWPVWFYLLTLIFMKSL